MSIITVETEEFLYEYSNVPQEIAGAVITLLDGCERDEVGIMSGVFEVEDEE